MTTGIIKDVYLPRPPPSSPCSLHVQGAVPARARGETAEVVTKPDAEQRPSQKPRPTGAGGRRLLHRAGGVVACSIPRRRRLKRRRTPILLSFCSATTATQQQPPTTTTKKMKLKKKAKKKKNWEKFFLLVKKYFVSKGRARGGKESGHSWWRFTFYAKSPAEMEPGG